MSHWQQDTFNSFDGLELFFRYKEPKIHSSKACIILHRGHEHSGRVTQFADSLGMDDMWYFAFDLRGHGNSKGTPAWAANFDVWVKDLNSFASLISQTFNLKNEDTILIANSVGSVMAVSWILSYGAKLKGCILGAPAFSIKLYIPFALPCLRLARKFSDNLFVTSYVRPQLLTRDPLQAQAYACDSLITKKIGVNILVSLFDCAKNLLMRAKDFESPCLILSAEKDYIVDNGVQTKFYDQISSTHKQFVLLRGFRHALFHEQNQVELLTTCRTFINACYADTSKQLPALIPKERAHTVAEFQALTKNDSKIKMAYFLCLRFLLQHLGSSSKGIALGLQEGFDSGASLDYVYRNKSAGKHAIGRIIDRIYLNAVGWQGIRIRKQNLKQALSTICSMIHQRGETPSILDIASGPGRYLFELKQEAPFPIELHLRDIEDKAITRAKSIAAELRQEAASFRVQDAFEKSYASEFETRPNIIIISGLFELYDDNRRVHQTICNMFDLLADNGFLVYTGQPWHPQLEVIGRLLNNSRGNRWIMRRRIQLEMDQLVESAGFNKLDTTADELGIFTVSCAQK